MDKQESRRIHEDWWGKCRTCAFWQGSDLRRMVPGLCTNPISNLHGQITWTEGYCPKWDSFDIETAFELMEEDHTKSLEGP
jgi:hypothetical protein